MFIPCSLAGLLMPRFVWKCFSLSRDASALKTSEEVQYLCEVKAIIYFLLLPPILHFIKSVYDNVLKASNVWFPFWSKILSSVSSLALLEVNIPICLSNCTSIWYEVFQALSDEARFFGAFGFYGLLTLVCNELIDISYEDMTLWCMPYMVVSVAFIIIKLLK